jgi:hypothetical protein
MTPTEKFNKTAGIARERLAKGAITFGAYSAILAAASAERDGQRASPKAGAAQKRGGPVKPRATKKTAPAVSQISPQDFNHLKAAIFEDRAPRRLSRNERAADFAERVERAAATRDGRRPLAHIEGPAQPVRRNLRDILADRHATR